MRRFNYNGKQVTVSFVSENMVHYFYQGEPFSANVNNFFKNAVEILPLQEKIIIPIPIKSEEQPIKPKEEIIKSTIHEVLPVIPVVKKPRKPRVKKIIKEEPKEEYKPDTSILIEVADSKDKKEDIYGEYGG